MSDLTTNPKSAIISLIKKKMQSWGHNFAPGCACCATALGIIEAIEAEIEDDERIVEGIRIKGPTS